MSMSSDQVQQHMMIYLEATDCQIIEKSPYHITVKLSPQADKQLTNRPYYWGFVERTGVDPETLCYTFVFDPERYTVPDVKPAPVMNSEGIPQDSILSRYFDVTPTMPRMGPGRILREDVNYGSQRLQQIWDAARREGSSVYLFEEPGILQRRALFSAAYEPWLAVCFKVEMTCDVKKEQLHFMGISLLSGVITEDFRQQLVGRSLSPRIPENVHINPAELSLGKAAEQLQSNLISSLGQLDYQWADQAQERLKDELVIIDGYYEHMMNDPDEEKNNHIREQYDARRSEMAWQYEPKVKLSAITCGLFHLRPMQ
ncbi:YqhG family protein [Paenibacillus sp. FA6]|uniref:YqhG family protein n=1 Tax=Paenibacillus sp. FA6 TaxID=3413029 RepID=UPI003F65F01F